MRSGAPQQSLDELHHHDAAAVGAPPHTPHVRIHHIRWATGLRVGVTGGAIPSTGEVLQRPSLLTQVRTGYRVQGWNMTWPVDYHVVPVWWSVCRKSVKLELATRFYYFELYVIILNRLVMKDIEIMGYRFKNLMKKITRLELSKMFAFQ